MFALFYFALSVTCLCRGCISHKAASAPLLPTVNHYRESRAGPHSVRPGGLQNAAVHAHEQSEVVKTSLGSAMHVTALRLLLPPSPHHHLPSGPILRPGPLGWTHPEFASPSQPHQLAEVAPPSRDLRGYWAQSACTTMRAESRSQGTGLCSGVVSRTVGHDEVDSAALASCPCPCLPVLLPHPQTVALGEMLRWKATIARCPLLPPIKEASLSRPLQWMELTVHPPIWGRIAAWQTAHRQGTF